MARAPGLAGLLALFLLPGVPGAGALPAAYAAEAGDLFPEDPDVDVAVRLEARASWDLLAQPLAPGGEGQASLQPVPGTLRAHVAYRMPRPCCPQQWLEGERTVVGQLPLPGADLPAVDLGEWVLALRLDGELRAWVRGQGATPEPTQLAWQDGEPRNLRVALGSSGEAPALLVASSYPATLRIEARAQGQPGHVAEAPLVLGGSQPLEFPLAVRSDGAAQLRAPAPAAFAALALAGLVAWAARRP